MPVTELDAALSDLQEHGLHWFFGGRAEARALRDAVSERLGRDIQLREAKPDWQCALIDLEVSEVITVSGIQKIARQRAQQRARGTSDDKLPM